MPAIPTEPLDERERAAEARHGGRMITTRLYRLQCWVDVAGIKPPSLVSDLKPERLAGIAQRAARGHDDSARPLTLSQAEAMLDWPIYRAALARPVGTFRTSGEWGLFKNGELARMAHDMGDITLNEQRDHLEAKLRSRPELTCWLCGKPEDDEPARSVIIDGEVMAEHDVCRERAE